LLEHRRTSFFDLHDQRVITLCSSQEQQDGTARAHAAHSALPHEKSAFVLFTKSFVSKYFPPFHQDHFFSHVALHNKRKLLSCMY
jgi:hypothetical protein